MSYRKSQSISKFYGLCILLLSLFNCSKTELPIDQIKKIRILSDSQKEVIRKAKDWYDLNENKDIPKSIENLIKETPPFIGTPNWDDASLFSLGETSLPGAKEMVRVPLNDYKVDRVYTSSMNPDGYRDLIMRKNENTYLLYIVEIHPDLDYIKSKKRAAKANRNQIRDVIEDKNFNGYFLVYSAYTNTLVYGEKRENGRISKKLEF